MCLYNMCDIHIATINKRNNSANFWIEYIILNNICNIHILTISK